MISKGILGNAIRAARISNNLSQEELAELVDITPTHLKHIESEHRKPSIEVLFRLAKVLNMSVDNILFKQPDSHEYHYAEILLPQLNVAGKTPSEIENIKAQKRRWADALQAFATQIFFYLCQVFLAMFSWGSNDTKYSILFSMQTIIAQNIFIVHYKSPINTKLWISTNKPILFQVYILKLS